MDTNDNNNLDFTCVKAVAKFLNSDFEKTFTKNVRSVMKADVDDVTAVGLLMAEIADIDTLYKDVKFFWTYYPKIVKKLSDREFTQNPYYKNVAFKRAKKGNFELCYEKYAVYEPFVYDDLDCDSSGMVLPKIGFFDKPFPYPAVKENGRIWMTVTPNEINTMKKPIEKARGKVLALGLGLGYFAYMTAIKNEVEKVTVVEISEDVIRLFKENILPQFPHPEKVEIIRADGLEFMKNPPFTDFDFIFCDLWHDVSDGVPLYEELKKCEGNFPNSQFEYWIEQSMKFYL